MCTIVMYVPRVYICVCRSAFINACLVVPDRVVSSTDETRDGSVVLQNVSLRQMFYDFSLNRLRSASPVPTVFRNCSFTSPPPSCCSSHSRRTLPSLLSTINGNIWFLKIDSSSVFFFSLFFSFANVSA